jgi:hypothetical protein
MNTNNSTRIFSILIRCNYLTRGSQAVAARIAGKPGILQAAGSGDIALVRDHLIANASCVHETDGCRRGAHVC